MRTALSLPVRIGVRLSRPLKPADRPRRSCRLEAKVTPDVYRAVEAFAIEHGYTLSTALNCVLLEWKKQREGAHGENL